MRAGRVARIACLEARAARTATPVGSTVVPGLTTTVHDRELVLEQLHTDFAQLQGDIFAAAGWRSDHPVMDPKSPIAEWWELDVRPTIEEWQKFYADQAGSWWSRWQTDWDVYTGWQDRLVALRQIARSKLAQHGKKLQSPDPAKIPRVPWQGLGDGARDTATDLAKLMKYVAYAAIGVGGIYAVSSIASITRRRTS